MKQVQLDLLSDAIPEQVKIWVAAAIEYEGNISIFKDCRGPTYRAEVRITNTKKDLVDCEELRLFGGSLIQVKETNPKWRPRWKRDYHGKQLIRLLKAIRPYLKTKGEQADITLKFVERQQLTPVQIPEYKRMWQRMRELNKRGSDTLAG